MSYPDARSAHSPISPATPGRSRRLAGTLVLRSFALAALCLAGAATQAQVNAPATIDAAAAPEPNLGQAVQDALSLTRSGIKAPGGARIEVVAGQLDPRLRLAPCRKVDPYLPPGAPPWGRTRVGLRCSSGPVAWNVYLPVTVKVWAQALVTRSALAAGAPIAAQDLESAEVDLAAETSPTFHQAEELLGRQLSLSLPPGTAIRAMHLRTRSWFAAGEQVTVIVGGTGYAVSASGQALSQGLEGQPVRVRTDAGRVITAWPVGENRVEVRL